MIVLGLASLLGAGAPDGPPSGRSSPRPAARTATVLGARWLGQDGHDLVGPSSDLKPSDVQDIHLVIVGIPARRRIASLRVRGEGGDEWTFNGGGHWRAEVQQAPGATSADVYLEPTRVENGRSYELALTFDDGATTSIWARALKADPQLRMPGAALSVVWAGQDRHDWVGPSPAVGPDGLQDCHLTLSKLSTSVKIVGAEIEVAGGAAGGSGTIPRAIPAPNSSGARTTPPPPTCFFSPIAISAAKSRG